MNTLEVRARFGETLLACASLGPPGKRWPSSLARAGAVTLGCGALALLVLGEPALGGFALALAAVLVVLGARGDPTGELAPFDLRRTAGGIELSWQGERRVVPLTTLPLCLASGELSLEIAPVTAPEGLPRSRARDPERRAVLGFALGSLVLHASLVALAFALPAPVRPGPHGRAARRPARLELVAPASLNGHGGPLSIWLSSGGESMGAARPRPPGVEVRSPQGARGRRGLYALRGPALNPDPHLARQLATEAVRGAGVLGLLGGRGAALAARGELAGALGRLMPNQIGEGYGVGGLGLVGTGRGGGGTGTGTVLSGALGTLGRGGGGGGGAGYGSGRWRTGRTISSCGGSGGAGGCVPSVIVGSSTSVCGAGPGRERGCLDKEVVRREVRRHINEVRYCYQKELQLYPQGLEGRVSIRFEIQPDGTVSSSRLAGSTLGVVAIEGCVAGAPRRWRFPENRGGGVTVVSYPFYFRSTGAS